MRFRARGTRVNRVEGRLFISEWAGPFNAEMLRDHSGQAMSERDNLMRTGPWGYIEIYLRSALAGPDFFEAETQNIRDPKRGVNRAAVALVIAPGVEGHGLVEPVFLAMWEPLPAPTRTFGDLEEAKTWVRSIVDPAYEAAVAQAE